MLIYYCPDGKLFHGVPLASYRKRFELIFVSHASVLWLGRQCELSCAEGYSLEKCKDDSGKKISMSECQPICTDGEISHKVVCSQDANFLIIGLVIVFLLIIPIAICLVFYVKSFADYKSKSKDGATWDAQGKLVEVARITRSNPLDDSAYID